MCWIDEQPVAPGRRRIGGAGEKKNRWRRGEEESVAPGRRRTGSMVDMKKTRRNTSRGLVIAAAAVISLAGIGGLAGCAGANKGSDNGNKVADDPENLDASQVCVLQSKNVIDPRSRAMELALTEPTSYSEKLSWQMITIDPDAANESGTEKKIGSEKKSGSGEASTNTDANADDETKVHYSDATDLKKVLDRQTCKTVLNLNPALDNEIRALAEKHTNRNVVTYSNEADRTRDKKDIPTNLQTYDFNLQQPAFLLGFATAGLTEHGYLGVLAEEPDAETTKFGAEIWGKAFAAGVKFYNNYKGSDIQIEGVNEADQTLNFKQRDQLGKQIKALKDAKVDYALLLSEVPDDKLWSELSEAGVNLIWAGEDAYSQFAEHQGLMFNSMLINPKPYLEQLVKEITENKFQHGQAYYGEFKNKGADIASFNEFDTRMSDELKKQLASVRKQLANGELNFSWETQRQ